MSYTSFRSGNLRLMLQFAGIKFPDTNGIYPPEFFTLGFSTGDATIETTVELKELTYGLPSLLLDSLVGSIGATITVNLREADVNKIAYLNWGQAVTTNNVAFNTSNITIQNIEASHFITTYPSHFDAQGRPILFLDRRFYNPVPSWFGNNTNYQVYLVPSEDRTRMIPQTFSVTHGGNSITSQFELREFGGIYYVVFLGTTLPDTTTDRIEITISVVNNASYSSLVLFNDPSKLAFSYKLLLVGRNMAGNNNALISLWVPRAKLTKPANINFVTTDYANIEVQFKPVVDFLQNTYPTDPLGTLRMMELREWESQLHTAHILNYYSTQ